MPETPFDPAVYARTPLVSLSAAVVLARALVTVAPKNLSGLPQRALNRMEKAAGTAEEALVTRQRALGAAGSGSIEIDTTADRIISGLRMRLDALALLPVDEVPQAARAAELSNKLFPEGLGFLKIPFVEQLAAMQTLVRHIDEERLGKELDALCGPEFLQTLRTILPRYRDMVEASLSQQDSPNNLQEQRRRLVWSISDYATKIAALADEEDPKSVERVRTALRPIDVIREQQVRRPAAPGDVDPEPLPEPPPERSPTPAPADR